MFIFSSLAISFFSLCLSFKCKRVLNLLWKLYIVFLCICLFDINHSVVLALDSIGFHIHNIYRQRNLTTKQPYTYIWNTMKEWTIAFEQALPSNILDERCTNFFFKNPQIHNNSCIGRAVSDYKLQKNTLHF